MQGGGQPPVIDVAPRAPVVADEVAAAGAAVDAAILDAGRQGAIVAKRAGGHQQPAAGAGDHLVRWPEMLEGVIHDGPHAFGDRLVLEMDAVDAAVDRIAALGLAVHAPVVAFVVHHAPAPEPVGGVGQQLVAAAGSTDRRAVAVGRLRQRHGRGGALPPDEDVHRVMIVERHPGAAMGMAVELAIRRLRPEGKKEIGEAPIGAASAGRTVSAVLRAPGNVGHLILRRPDRDGVIERLVLGELFGIDMAAVQVAEMRGVDLALDRLQVVAITLDHADVDLAVGCIEDLQRRQRRRLGARPHIDPDQPGTF